MTSFAFVFPGQGSQTVGMLDAWGDHPAVRDTLAEASAALGEDIGRLIHDGPKEQLDLTKNQAPSQVEAESTEAVEQKKSERHSQNNHHPRPARRVGVHV